MTDRQFTVDWTSHHFQDWARWLGHLKNLELDGLEIGSFEGRSAVWFMQNVLTHGKSRLHCVDPWDYADEKSLVDGGGTYIAEQFNWLDVRQRFDANTAQWRDEIRVHAEPSRVALRKMLPLPTFDFVYLDGSHVARCVLEDSVLAWPLVKPGGTVIWDDYDWTQSKPNPFGDPELSRPKIAIDAFLHCYRGCWDDHEYSNGQIKVRKVGL